jgi:signal peptidase II
LVLDALTKAWAQQALALYQPVPLAGQFVRLTLGYNAGVAFGLLAQHGPWLIIVNGPIIVGLAFWLLWALRTGALPSAAAWPAGLVLGGALGNFVDRWPDGRVTDFLDVGVGTTRWPAFNAADSCIVVGLALLLWLTCTVQHTEETQR